MATARTPTRPKVLILGKVPPPYIGPAIATEIILRSRLRERYQLVHVDQRAHRSLNEIGTIGIAKVLRSAAVYARFAAALLRERPDLVLIPFSQTTFGFVKDSVFMLLCRLTGTPVLVQLRGSNIKRWLASAWPSVRIYFRTVIRGAAGAVVLGHNLRHLFEDLFPPDRIFVVPNGADYEFPQRQPRTDGDTHCLYLANLQPSKGVEDVIRAAAVLGERGVNGFVIDVVGAWRDDDTRDMCMRLTEEHGVPVRFHGPKYGDDKLRAVLDADVFLFVPREPEGHPWVIVEALAAGLPIISTDQGAITESVEDGVNGFIVDPYHPEQIADRLQLLLADTTLRQAMGERSRARYLGKFTEAHMVEEMSAAFDTVMARSPVEALAGVRAS